MLHPISETGKSKKIFLRISKGAIISKRNGEVTSFEVISGSIKGIELKEHEFENKKFATGTSCCRTPKAERTTTSQSAVIYVCSSPS